MAGRPSLYSEELTDIICERLVLGESLNKICKDADMPSLSIVFKWLGEKPEFLEKYNIAKEAQADTLADQIMDISDEMPLMNPTTGAVDSGAVQHQRLRVDARKWIAAKLKPKKYGDKVQTEVTGKDGGPVHQVTTIRIVAGDGSNSKDST